MRLPNCFRAAFAACAFLAAGAAAAQASCPPPPPTLESLRPEQLQADVRDRGYLWRLTRDGRSSWLYGTVHVSRPEWLLPGPQVQRAFRESEVLAMELDLGDPELRKVFGRPGDPERIARVTAGLLPRIAEAAARACLPPGMPPLQPILQLTTLSLFETRRDGYHPELAIDAMLWGLAQRLGKPVVALESPASQLAALTPESEADEHALITQSLAEIESGEGRSTMRRLLKAWSEGDEATLASYPEWCNCLESPEERRYMRRVNDDRNGPIADRLVTLHAAGRPFFAAVGSLHMTGPQALPRLLQERGFQVQRIPFEARP